MTTESQDLGLTSHPKDGACWQCSVPISYRVELHLSYLKKVFSFIRFIKDRYSFKFLSETPEKKLNSETYRKPEGVYLAQKYSIIQIVKNIFFFTLAMFSMRIQLFNGVNKLECMK